MQVLLTSIGSMNLFRHLIFEFFFFQMLMLKQLQMRHPNKIRETNGGKIKEQYVPLT